MSPLVPRPVALLAALSCAGVLGACGGTSATSLVRAKVEQFATAVHAHDYRTLCTQVLGPNLLADIAAGGISCERALRLGLSRVSDARLTVGTITITGATAEVLTVSQARHEHTALARLELARTGAGWRISSLGNAA